MIKNTILASKDILKDQEVNIISIDEYCETNSISKIDLLKIDTQGYEEQVLSGCYNLIKNNSVI